MLPRFWASMSQILCTCQMLVNAMSLLVVNGAKSTYLPLRLSLGVTKTELKSLRVNYWICRFGTHFRHHLSPLKECWRKLVCNKYRNVCRKNTFVCCKWDQIICETIWSELIKRKWDKQGLWLNFELVAFFYVAIGLLYSPAPWCIFIVRNLLRVRSNRQVGKAFLSAEILPETGFVQASMQVPKQNWFWADPWACWQSITGKCAANHCS